MRLADRTTLRVGGPADHWVRCETDEHLIGAVRSCDAAGIPALILGGGSNLLASDGGFRGTVLEVATRGMTAAEGDGDVALTIRAGEPWDDVVESAVLRGWSGIEALSGIPGLAGATPIQNVGAYGQDVGQVVSAVRILDRRTGTVERLDHLACGFGYRSSAFTAEPFRWVVLDVTMQLRRSPLGVVRYAELAQALGVDVGSTADVADIRAAVLRLRGRKGMVLDPDDPDTRSAGSFFTNPIVSGEVAASVPAECPRYPSPNGTKLSAAWLIEQAGVGRGWRARRGSPARVSTKHTLALINEGHASADDILELARAIRDLVEERFGITLRAEVRMVGCAL
ncbi:MAG: UDP-N-acetylmuramate dehydrogenase [Actinobacteria bacterium]|nr:UDP-N-acetylmuramate dehydrogenase [Actinomycetota bacterium]